MTVRKSAEVDLRKKQEWRKSAIFMLRKSAEVCGTRLPKPAENRAEVCGSVAEVRPPLKRATFAAALIEAGRAKAGKYPHLWQGAGQWIEMSIGGK